jgi:hypothetical protein
MYTAMDENVADGLTTKSFGGRFQSLLTAFMIIEHRKRSTRTVCLSAHIHPINQTPIAQVNRAEEKQIATECAHK